MSGLVSSAILGGPPPFFFSFWPACFFTRQSDTAAAQTATSTGKAAWQADNISSADSTGMTETPGGSASRVGPETRVVSAPRRASARAIAWPCRPEERFAM